MRRGKHFLVGTLLLIIAQWSASAQIQGLDLLGSKKFIEIPFELQQGFIIVKARFNNSIILDFIFDTGAENTLIFDREIAELFGIEYDRRIEIIGSDFTTGLYANIARKIIFKLDAAQHVTRDIVVLEDNILLMEEKLGIHVDGIIGGSFFQNLVVYINYPKRKIRLYHPQSIKPSLHKGFESFDIRVLNNKPYIKAKTTLANGTVLDLTFLIDSGASLPMLLHTNSDSLLSLPELTMTGALGYGITGILRGFIGQVNNFEIGPFAFPNLITSFQDIEYFSSNPEGLSRNGIIGSHLLRRFYVIIDYFHSKFYLKPIKKKKYAQSFDHDRSGLVIFAVGLGLDEFLIKEVMRNSPAEEADFMAGDILTKIGWRKTKFMALEAINAKLQGRSEKKLKLEIERDDKKIKKELILKDWFVPTRNN